jgi:hypothetical protein
MPPDELDDVGYLGSWQRDVSARVGVQGLLRRAQQVIERETVLPGEQLVVPLEQEQSWCPDGPRGRCERLRSFGQTLLVRPAEIRRAARAGADRGPPSPSTDSPARSALAIAARNDDARRPRKPQPRSSAAPSHRPIRAYCGRHLVCCLIKVAPAAATSLTRFPAARLMFQRRNPAGTEVLPAAARRLEAVQAAPSRPGGRATGPG